MNPSEIPLFEVSASAELLLQAGDFFDAGVLTVDAGLVVRGWNRWLEAASGRSAAEAIGRPLLDLFPELAGTRAEASFRRALAGETVVLAHRFHEFLLPLPADPTYAGFGRMQQSARIVPVIRKGRMEGALAVVQDVTERVAREAELRAAMEEAEHASEAKSEFMARLSHELRTPLGAIMGYTDLLDAGIGGPLAEKQAEHVRRVRAGAHHMLGIIDEILTFSRVEAGREPLHLAPVDLVSVARDALAMVEPLAQQKALVVRVDLPDAPVEMTTDAGKLRQILVNLLGNATKFTDHGEVVLRLAREADRILLHVRDTGSGIPAEYLERIFEPFTQVESAGPQTGFGTGLGLPVSRRLARLLGGNLHVESTPGAGSQFTLVLPISTPA